TAVAQAWYNKQAGTKTLTTETGAGQWGSALAFSCSLVGLACKVFMVRISFDQKPFRKTMMETWGATCVASPSNETAAGRSFLAKDPNTPGSLGMAISEAVEAAVSDPSGSTKYALGSVLNHVMLHQTIIGLEAKKQLASIGIKNPDIVIGCVGGGSNFAGIAFPFVADKIAGAKIEIIPVEPTSCPSITRGLFTYDFGDSAGMTPLLPMHTLGHNFVPQPIHAGGLRYHGMAPLVSQATTEGLLSPRAVPQLECYRAAIQWAKSEGFLVAPETSHAVAVTIQEALKAKEEGKEKVILMNLSGHGLMDLLGYQKFLAGQLSDYTLPQAEIDKAESELDSFPKASNKKSGKW
nr:TrpB-like pyridoxal phosphate-dependent enzyme [Chitinispirillaceae bacterium]